MMIDGGWRLTVRVVDVPPWINTGQVWYGRARVTRLWGRKIGECEEPYSMGVTIRRFPGCTEGISSLLWRY